jgi:hypothetical protein
MDRGHLLQIILPMLAGCKLEIAQMRLEGATQAEIDLMLHEFEEVYAPDDDAEGKLVVAVLRQAARLSSWRPYAPRYSTRAEASGQYSERRDHATKCK